MTLVSLLAAILPALAPPTSPPREPPRRSQVYVENGLSLGVDLINDRPDLVLDVAGRRVGIVDRNRAAFELMWLPRVGYTFGNGTVLGLYGGLGFTGPSTPQLGLQLDARGVHVQTVRNHNTAAALSVMGGTFVGFRGTLASGTYLLPTVGVAWRGHQNERLNSKLMVDLRFDVGFALPHGNALAVGPAVRMAAFAWGGLSTAGMREVSFNLVATWAYGLN